MRLRTYAAPTVTEAMELVRQEMGDDAIIVSTHSTIDGLGARVTAAVEDVALDADLDLAWPEEDFGSWEAPPAEPEEQDELEECLSYHGVPNCFIDQLSARMDRRNGKPESSMLALASMLGGGDLFQPVEFWRQPGRYILVGAPGAGKTIATAKIIVEAFKRGVAMRPITTDVQRAGGIDQLQAFMRIIGSDLTTAKTPEDLEQALSGPGNGAVCIDTPGVNPFDEKEMGMLRELIAASRANPLLVMSAGLDPYECADVAQLFANLGISSALATRLDAARRLGGLLSLPLAAGIGLGATSSSAKVADPVSPTNPVSFARLLISKMNAAVLRA